MRSGVKRMIKNSKKGVTLVELVVAMALTSIFAVLCVALINPIERTYRGTLKLARAQLLADTIVDSIRKECDDVKHDEKTSVWIGNMKSSDDGDLISKGPAIKENGGNVLVFQRNSNYTEAIYSCSKISAANITNVENNPLTPTNTAHSIKAMDGDDKEANLKSGIVHFGYYQAREDDRGIFPIKSYDYTNPVLASTYGDFTVDVSFKDLTFSKSGKNPVYVTCTVRVLQKGAALYTRTAVLCFAANGSGSGSGSKPTPKPVKNVRVKLVWKDNNDVKRPADGLTVMLKNDSGTVIASHHVAKANKPIDEQEFVFYDVNTSDGVNLTINPSIVPHYGYLPKSVANGFVVTFTAKNNVTLIPGPDFNNLVKNKGITHFIFGSNADLLSKAASGFVADVSCEADGTITPDYKLYIVNDPSDGTKTAYVLSDSGTFIGNKTMKQMFANCSDVVMFTGINSIDTSNTDTMYQVFINCRSLSMEKFEVRWNTSKVESMDGMFRNVACAPSVNNDVTIDISSFDFSSCRNVENEKTTGINKMFLTDVALDSHITTIRFPADKAKKNMSKLDKLQEVFSGCDHLENLENFNDFNFSSVNSISLLFNYCTSLEKVDFSNWNLSSPGLTSLKNKDNKALFTGLTNLKEINLSGLSIPYVSDITSLLSGPSNLEKVNLNGLNAPKVTSLNKLFASKQQLREVYMNGITICAADNETWTADQMFMSCNNLETVELENLVTKKCTSLSEMFKYCTNLANLDFTGWEVSSVTSMYNMFYSCYSKNTETKTLDISSFVFNTDELINMEGMFYNSGYTTIKLPNTNGVAMASNIKSMFRSCKNLINVENLNGASFPAATDASYLFAECENLGTGTPKTFSITLNIPNADWVNNMFNKTKNVEKIDISGSDFRTAGSLGDMFNGSTELQEVVMDGVNLANCSSFTNPFTNCGNLTTIHMNSIDLRKAANLSFLNWNNNNLKNLELESANLSGLTAISSLFSGRTVIEYINFSDVTLGSGYTSASQMFYNCKRLKKLEIRNFTAPASCSQMFMNCCSLAEIDLSGWNTTATKDMSSMFCQVATKEKNSGIEPQLPAGVDKIVLDVSSFDFTNVTSLKYIIGIEKQNEYEDRLNKIILPAGDKGNASKVTDSQRAFRYRTQVTQIDNLEYLQLSNTCTNTSGMFSRIDCSELDIRGIHINNAVMDYMFDNCANLERIYAAPDADFSVSGKSAKEMFKESRKIVGGNGTTYIGDGKTYAKIDGGASNPGYFTDYNQKPATGG